MDVVSALPPELVTRIFSFVDDPWQWAPPTRGPVLMSHICAYWRSVALNDPSLWTTIYIRFRIDHYTSGLVHQVKAWFARSKGLLVNVCIDAKPRVTRDVLGPGAIMVIQKVLATVRNNAARIRSLYMLCGQNFKQSPYHLVGELAGMTAPALADLRIHLAHADNSDNYISGFRELGHVELQWTEHSDLTRRLWPCFSAPALRRITLGHIAIPVRGVLPSVTHVEGWTQHMDPYMETLPAIAAKFPGIETLVMQRCSVNQDPEFGAVHREPITRLIDMPKLRHLSVSFSQALCHSALKYAVVPNLECLEFGYEVPGVGLRELLPAPDKMPRLRKLCLRSFARLGPVNMHIRAFFRDLESVEHLHLIDTTGAHVLPVTGSPVTALNRRRSITSLQDMNLSNSPSNTLTSDFSMFPRLHTVTLDTLKASDVAWLCNFVAVREHCIRTVRLSPSAMRHLEGSLRRRGDRIETVPLTMLGSRKHTEDAHLPRDVAEWLRARVKVEEPDDEGLYQVEREVYNGQTPVPW